MRIIAGAWRGRGLVAPAGGRTRPTAERLRQALFDMLAHAPWAVPFEGAEVLDLFAGTGALGLEALSRGAARCSFVETDGAARACLAANIAACGAGGRAAILPCSAIALPVGPVARLVFLDPPYGQGLADTALVALPSTGRVDENSLIICETAAAEPVPPFARLLAERVHGAGRMSIGSIGAGVFNQR